MRSCPGRDGDAQSLCRRPSGPERSLEQIAIVHDGTVTNRVLAPCARLEASGAVRMGACRHTSLKRFSGPKKQKDQWP